MKYLPDDFFYTHLSRLQRLYTKSLTMRLSPLGVSPGYLSTLHYLWQKDGVTQKALCLLMDIEQATLSNTLKRMERDSLIQRIPNPKDKRHQLISLTAKGSGLQKTVAGELDDLRKTVNTGLTINDLKYFNRILRQMSEHLDNDLSEPLFLLLDEVQDS